MIRTEEERFQGAQIVMLALNKLRSDLEMPCGSCHVEVDKCPSAQCKSDRQITICQAKQMVNILWATLEFLSGRKVTFSKKTAFRKAQEKGAL